MTAILNLLDYCFYHCDLCDAHLTNYLDLAKMFLQLVCEQNSCIACHYYIDKHTYTLHYLFVSNA